MSAEPMGWLSRVWRGEGTRVVLPENGGRAYAFRPTPALRAKFEEATDARKVAWLSKQHAAFDVTAPAPEREEIDAACLRVVERLEAKVRTNEELEAENRKLRERVAELEAERAAAIEQITDHVEEMDDWAEWIRSTKAKLARTEAELTLMTGTAGAEAQYAERMTQALYDERARVEKALTQFEADAKRALGESKEEDEFVEHALNCVKSIRARLKETT